MKFNTTIAMAPVVLGAFLSKSHDIPGFILENFKIKLAYEMMKTSSHLGGKSSVCSFNLYSAPYVAKDLKKKEY